LQDDKFLRADRNYEKRLGDIFYEDSDVSGPPNLPKEGICTPG